MKKAKDIKIGDKIKIGTDTLVVTATETSDIGKQGTQKCRIVAKKSTGEEVVIIRPSDYPINTA